MKKRIVTILTVCMCSLLFISGCSSKSGQYDKAKELMNNGQYAEAAEIFTAITDYEDSKELYNSCMYSQGTALMNEGNYSGAKECFESIPDYEDASELIAECEHQIAVKNDTTAPVISGVNEGEIIEAKFNEDFNLKDYLAGIVKVEDDISESVEYKITTSSKIYDPDNGKIDTLQDGSFDFSINSSDEAGNKSTVNFQVYIDATLYITAETEFPVVLYSNELGEYYLNSVKHYSDWESAPDYLEGYYLQIEMMNGMDVDALCYFGKAYLNDYRVPVYTDSSKPIAPGKKGIINSHIYDDDITESMQGFEKIECSFMIADEDKNVFFERPVVIDSSVIQ